MRQSVTLIIGGEGGGGEWQTVGAPSFLCGNVKRCVLFLHSLDRA